MVKVKEINAEALQGWFQGKWDSNNRLTKETFERLGKKISIQKSVLLLHDVSSPEYRQLLDDIFEDCSILDCCKSNNELIWMTTREFGLTVK